MNKPVIICIDDEPIILESLKLEIKKAIGNDCIIETAEGGEEALDLLAELQQENCEVALVLSDYIMPDLKGDELLKRIHEMSPKTLKIMLTGQADVEAVGNAVRYAKLYRYLPKPWESEDLKLTVFEAIHSYLQEKKLEEQNFKLQQMNQELERLTREQAAIIRERTESLEKANQELQRLAITDSLTKIANRHRFDEYFTEKWEEMRKEKKPLSLIMCDVDFFKSYNDRYGHPEGDNCLFLVATAISNAVKVPESLVARYGGEEFVVVMSNTTLEEAVAVAEAIRREVKELKIVNAQSKISKYVTISLGVSSWVPTAKFSREKMIKETDIALYEAKNLGRDRVIFKTFAPWLDRINAK